MLVIDTETHTVTATIGVGNEPVGIAVDPLARSVYVTNLGDNTVSVIDADTRTVIATVGVGSKPNAVAVDPGTGVAYAANRSDKGFRDRSLGVNREMATRRAIQL